MDAEFLIAGIIGMVIIVLITLLKRIIGTIFTTKIMSVSKYGRTSRKVTINKKK